MSPPSPGSQTGGTCWAENSAQECQALWWEAGWLTCLQTGPSPVHPLPTLGLCNARLSIPQKTFASLARRSRPSKIIFWPVFHFLPSYSLHPFRLPSAASLYCTSACSIPLLLPSKGPSSLGDFHPRLSSSSHTSSKKLSLATQRSLLLQATDNVMSLVAGECRLAFTWPPPLGQNSLALSEGPCGTCPHRLIILHTSTCPGVRTTCHPSLNTWHPAQGLGCSRSSRKACSTNASPGMLPGYRSTPPPATPVLPHGLASRVHRQAGGNLVSPLPTLWPPPPALPVPPPHHLVSPAHILQETSEPSPHPNFPTYCLRSRLCLSDSSSHSLCQ